MLESEPRVGLEPTGPGPKKALSLIPAGIACCLMRSGMFRWVRTFPWPDGTLVALSLSVTSSAGPAHLEQFVQGCLPGTSLALHGNPERLYCYIPLSPMFEAWWQRPERVTCWRSRG